MNRRWKALIFAVVPGLGHLYLGRHWRGLLCFAIFAMAVNGMYMAYEMGSDEMGLYVFTLCRGAAVAIWLYSVFHVAYLGKRFESKPATERKDYHFKRGLTQFLAGSFDGAEQEFRAVLKLDPMDVDARFQLAMTHKTLGQTRKASKGFKRCLADDLDGKWKWEVRNELDRLKQERKS